MHALHWALAHGVLNTLFALWTFGGSVFLLFLNELGLPKGQIGALLALFPFCGILALWFAPIAARWGWKRVFLAGYGSRKVVMALMLLLPLVLAHGGRTAGMVWLVSILVIFAVLRALAETAYYPWSQEFIPNAIRGKFTGLSLVLGTCASGLALYIAGQVIGHGVGLSRYLPLMGVGCFLGLLGIACMSKVPGGAPRLVETPAAHRAELAATLRDGNFLAYLRGMGGFTLGSLLCISFLPLYVKEQQGVAPGTVVVLDAAVMIGGALSSLFWGWAADRAGSRKALLPALAMSVLIPLGWLLLPRHAPQAIIWCAALYFLYGVAANGIALGAGRLLFNSVVPAERSTAYTAIYYAWMGITGGMAPLLAGGILAAKWPAWLGSDGHRCLFLLSFVFLALGWWSYRQVKPDTCDNPGAVLARVV